MRVPLLLLASVLLAGCLGDPSVHYWHLESRLDWEGETDGVLLERGPHCRWLTFHGDHLELRRGWGDPKPDGHVLGMSWTGDAPRGDTIGSGYAWWFGSGAVPQTVEGEQTLVDVSWDYDTLLLDGEPGRDGWNRTFTYPAEGLTVHETLTLRDHGRLPVEVHTQRSLECD